jgi:hypothetical protein
MHKSYEWASATEPLADVSGHAPGMVVKAWFTVGCVFLAFIAWVTFQWITGPYFRRVELPPGIEVPLQFKIVGHAVEVVMGTVWASLIWTQIIQPYRKTGAPKTVGLLGVAFFIAIFWDPAMNWIQQGCVYNPYFFNRGFLSPYIPGWMSPRGGLLAEPLLAWAGGYPGFLILMAVSGLALMRLLKARFPTISNTTLMAAGLIGSMACDAVVETLLIRHSGIYAYPGSIRALSLFGGHWYQFPIYESLCFGGWVGFCSILLYFKDDKGLTWVERGVEKLDMCKNSNFRKALVRAIAVLGFCQVVELIVYVLPMPLFTANADPFPDDTPAFFTVGAGMSGPGTGLSSPRPDLPIIRRDDLEKFKDTPQISSEEATARAAARAGRR